MLQNAFHITECSFIFLRELVFLYLLLFFPGNINGLCAIYSICGLRCNAVHCCQGTLLASRVFELFCFMGAYYEILQLILLSYISCQPTLLYRKLFVFLSFTFSLFLYQFFVFLFSDFFFSHFSIFQYSFLSSFNAKMKCRRNKKYTFLFVISNSITCFSFLFYILYVQLSLNFRFLLFHLFFFLSSDVPFYSFS